MIRINLKGRDVSGTTPNELGFLHYLKFLDLRNNDIAGFLPSDMNWVPLETFKVVGNHLKGIIPHLFYKKEGANSNHHKVKFSCNHID